MCIATDNTTVPGIPMIDHNEWKFWQKVEASQPFNYDLFKPLHDSPC